MSSRLSLTLVTLGLALSACRREKPTQAAGPPVVPVSVAPAVQQTMPVELRLVGTVEASAVVQVKSQVAGELLRVHFTEGQDVAKDAMLFDIDPRPFQEALKQAEAAVVRDRAQIAQAEATLGRDAAQLKNAETELHRNTELLNAKVIAKSQFDQVETTAEVARESVRASKAAIETARAALNADIAAVDKAKLDLSYCQIRAPIAGRTGNLLVHAGNLVKVNDVPLVVIHQVTPIFVTFNVPEEHLNAVRRRNAAAGLTVRVMRQDDPSRTSTGKVSVIDNTVDPATGNIKLKAVCDNRDTVLWPGEFVNVVLGLDAIADAIVVPAEAVQSGQQGSFIYVVKADQSVEPRVVTSGETYQGKTVIQKGIAAGDTVVTDGQLRLFPGAHIQAVKK